MHCRPIALLCYNAEVVGRWADYHVEHLYRQVRKDQLRLYGAVGRVGPEVLMKTLACPTLGWLERSEAEETCVEPALAEQFRMEDGRRVHQRAYELFPDSVVVKSPAMTSEEVLEDCPRSSREDIKDVLLYGAGRQHEAP